MYKGTAMNGRRGVVIHAMGAIDMALWDLKGKALGKPVHELLGGAVKTEVIPYASLLPKGNSFAAYRDALVDAAVRSKELGFRAVKAEILMNGPYTHEGMRESYDRHSDVVAAVRKAIGPDIVLMVDVGYLWPDAASCLEIVRDWAEFDIYFLETPVWSDDIEELRKVREAAPMKVAAGEWLATRYEFKELMDVGGVQVAQPDVGRVGGLSEAQIVCDMAADRGVTIVPHCWKTGISISATGRPRRARQRRDRRRAGGAHAAPRRAARPVRGARCLAAHVRRRRLSHAAARHRRGGPRDADSRRPHRARRSRCGRRGVATVSAAGSGSGARSAACRRAG
jgi:L-alanine-DL-glutamate epimerase-like enolase superfamily enzyme